MLAINTVSRTTALFLPFPGDPERWSPMDVPRAAVDFPNMNFLIYHSGFRDVGEVLPAARDGFQKNSYIPWTSDLCTWKKKNPQVKNVFMEMGSTFAMMVSASPVLAAHVIGMIVDAFGADAVQTAGVFVGALTELAAGMEIGQHQLNGGHVELGMHVHRNTAAIVTN